MTATPDLADRYLAAWNATDPAARRALLDEVFAEDVTYTDPLADVAGLAAAQLAALRTR